MKLTMPAQIILFLVVFITLSWMAMHAHLNTQWLSKSTNSENHPGPDDTRNALLRAQQKLEAIKSLSQTVPTPAERSAQISKAVHAASKLHATGKRPKLHAVTYASHHGRDDRFCRSVESAVRHKYELVILGWQVKWRGLSQKLEAAYSFAASLPENDLMLFTDAFDVLYTSESDRIVDVFLSHNYTILFAAECGCWPHVMDDVKICTDKYPQSPTPYRYLNSGTWIGYAKQARDMLAEVIRLAGKNFDNANDQKLVADMFLAGTHGIQLDYQCEVFQSMHRTDPPPLPSCNPSLDLELSSEKRWFNKRTKSFPAIFHFNGGGKEHHLRMENKVWYKDSSYYSGNNWNSLISSVILVPNHQPSGTLRFDEICSDYVRSLGRH
jgi:hypothetical protein